MKPAESSMLDVGCWIFDVRCPMFDVRCSLRKRQGAAALQNAGAAGSVLGRFLYSMAQSARRSRPHPCLRTAQSTSTLFNTVTWSCALTEYVTAAHGLAEARPGCSAVFPVRDYDLAATLASGQCFRWRRSGEAWSGVVSGRWVKLQQRAEGILTETAEPQAHWQWLADYLQVEVNLEDILASFPDDAPMRAAVAACHGLRVLRQEPWECLAAFILSSTKQIVQIGQIVAALSARYGTPVAVPHGEPAAFAFPTAGQIAGACEADLRACKMGFRAPNLLETARMVASGGLDLESIRSLPLLEARARLMELPGVGGKIADCVLLFAYGFAGAFPVDVWVNKALKELYFPKRRITPRRLRHFVATHFGPHAGYAQQYLFHYMRTRDPNSLSP